MPDTSVATTAFARVVQVLGTDRVANLLGIASRSVDRMRNGSRPPNPRLMRELADRLERADLANQLRDAADAMEAVHG